MKMSILKHFCVIIFLLLCIIACTSNEPALPGTVLPKDVYFDYKIWSEEGKDVVTCLLQFRYRRETGRTIKINTPGQVELDGELVMADSAKITGPFYEIQKPIDDFIGRHTITVTDINQKKYIEEFNFYPFHLNTEPAETLYRNDWEFDLAGLQPIDYLRVIAIDTSFSSEDINEIDTVRNGKLVITKEKLRKLVDGPITLVLNKEDEKSIKNGTDRGGKISITYGLKRDVTLVEEE